MTDPQLSPEAEQALRADLEALHAELRTERSDADLRHLRKMTLWGRLLSFAGLGTAWLGINPFSVLALALGSFARWAIVGHHVCHGALDQRGESRAQKPSQRFARGWRRVVDWMDWMAPEAWHYEHDVQHHYHLGEDGDPDVAEDNAWWLRDSRVPVPLRVVIVLLGSLGWKAFYYAPNTLNELENHRRGTRYELADWRLWSPLRGRFWRVMWHCWLPYSAWRFGLLPALFLPLGTAAWQAALVNLLLAELVTNFWSFWVIVPNHTGEDLYRFDTPARGKGQFYLRQIIGSVDYRCGGDLNDFLQGWLNYQIEHHLFPELTPRQYQRAHPRLKEICARHGIPFVQESVFRRAWRTMQILIGTRTMKRGTPLVLASATATR